MRANAVLGGWGLLLCLAGCASSRSDNAAESASLSLSRADQSAAASGSAASDTAPRRGRFADLVLEAPSTGTLLSFGKREIPQDSCELYEGCALGAGRRAIAEINVSVRNIGRGPFKLGER